MSIRVVQYSDRKVRVLFLVSHVEYAPRMKLEKMLRMLY